MNIAVFIERFFSVNLLIVGLSHAIQPKLWRDFFILIKNTRVAGIIIAMFTLPVGLAIIIGHNIWVFDLPVIITVCGWGLTTKSLIYALIPSVAERMIPDDSHADRKYALAGGSIIPLSLLLIWHSFFRLS